MTTFRPVRIGDLGLVVTGRTPPAASPSEFGGDIPFVTPTDIDGASRFLTTERAVSAAWDSQQGRISLPARAVCVVCIGATIGKICMTSMRSQSNQQINSVIVHEAFDPFFVYYKLSTLKNMLRQRATGAATPIINKSAFSDIVVEVPSLHEQRRIASILSAYDDLIEVNRRRVAILEEMARRLFEEWFVYLRFPGHETVPVHDTPDGPLPEGWSAVAVNQIASMLSGFAFKSSTFQDGGKYRVVTIKNVQNGHFLSTCESMVGNIPINMPEHCLLNDGDICMSLTGNVGRVCLVYGGEYLLNQRVSRIQPVDADWRSFVYCLFRGKRFQQRLIQHANGVAQQNLSPVQAGRLLVLVPKRDLVQKFETIVSSIIDGMVTLSSQILNLTRQRDLLLPRLISGEISVAQAPIPNSLLEAAD